MSIVSRIVKWNEQRYAQPELTHGHMHSVAKILSESLLEEELKEFKDSINAVDELDALVDIIFVAVGACWKLGMTDSQIKRAIEAVIESNETKEVPPSLISLGDKYHKGKGENYVSPTEKLKEILYDY